MCPRFAPVFWALTWDFEGCGGASSAPNLHQMIVDRNGGSELRFEVNGQMFFVNFVPEEGRWYCYAPTPTGVQRIPVSMDASPFQAYMVAMDEQAKENVN
jgi:hypothetical protein